MIENLSDKYKSSNISENWLFQLFNQDSYLSFDGVDDFIDFGTANSSSAICLDNTDKISIAFWINFPTLGTTEPIFRSHDHSSHYIGYGVTKRSDDKIQLDWYDGTGTGSSDRRTKYGSTALSANTWYFIVITSSFAIGDGGTNFYINNVLETTNDGGGTANITSPNYTASNSYSGVKTIMGQKLPSTDAWGEFKIKNFAIWSGIISSTARTTIYNSGNFLSLEENYGNYLTSSNLRAYYEFINGENYIQDLSEKSRAGSVYGATYKDFLGLAYKDTVVDDVFYHGFVNSSSAVRDSIDLNNSTAKSANVSFSVSNFSYQGAKLYENILFSDKYYINKLVKIFSQPSNSSSMSDCVQIYNGRLTDITTDESGLINFKTSSKTPWDFITFPQQKTETTQQYIPIVYGNYTTNTYGDKVTNMDYLVYPSPILRIADPNILSISAKAESTILPHYYESSVDGFIPINTSNFTSSTKNNDSGYDSNAIITELDNTLKRSFKTRPVSITGTDGHDSGSNRLLLHSGSTQGMAYSGQGSATTAFNFPSLNGLITELNLLIKGQIEISPGSYGSSVLKIDVLWSDGSTDLVLNASNQPTSFVPYSTSGSFDVGTEYDNYNNTLALSKYQEDYLLPALSIKTTVQHSTGFGVTATTQEFLIHYVIENDFTSEAKSKSTYKELEKLKYIYLANDGLESSIIDTTTVSGVITKGLHAHRDLLARFTGYDVDDSALYNWSTQPSNGLNVNSLRSNWSLRYWALKPVSLKKKLEQLQKEFGFIFKWRPNGDGSYWVVKDSYSSSDVATTLSYQDISNIDISHTPMSDLITKMDINYKKHPAEDRMLLSQTSQDLTSNPTPRKKWGIREKENLLSVDLEMNVDAVGNTDVGDSSSNPNDGYADYYMNIFGDVKKIISCEVVNSAKGYLLESGDIIKFDISEIKPFGSDWNNYYMVTNIQKSLGKIKITCREVG